MKVNFLNLTKEISINNNELVKGINSLDYDERLEIAAGINVEVFTIPENKRLLFEAADKLLESDLNTIDKAILSNFFHEQIKKLKEEILTGS